MRNCWRAGAEVAASADVATDANSHPRRAREAQSFHQSCAYVVLKEPSVTIGAIAAHQIEASQCKQLTDRQQRVYEYIVAYAEKHGYADKENVRNS